jgi:hypothetical protein
MLFYIILLLIALAVATNHPSFAWIAVVAIIIGGSLAILGGKRSAMINPFPGASIHKSPPGIYVCPEHSYRIELYYYNRHNPPTCPTCGKILTRQ